MLGKSSRIKKKLEYSNNIYGTYTTLMKERRMEGRR
jgi:hypothetical protein